MIKDLMKFDPATGKEKPYPSSPQQYRDYHGCVAWLHNPYTGKQRDPKDIGMDVLGYGIVCGESIKGVL